tara:strand:- start:11624 stop:12667 length:1044 start_codon:yes stop_codon:yes gene_type:complete
MFDNKVLLITGGTGSFGNAVLKRFLKSKIKEVRIFSRDEKKQDDMRKFYNNSKIKFYVGDVRDFSSLEEAMRGVDYIFHAAALKQVPSCEFYPMQAVQTNIIGTHNVISSAIKSNVKKVICLSTDKAVYPINTMGISKAMMEKVMVASSRNISNNKTVICGTRYGNVMASRGSVIPLMFNQALSGSPITITDPRMTRFMMSLDDAVDLVIYAFVNGKNGDIFVQKSPATTIETLSKSILEILNMSDHPIKEIGIRHGEKLHEVLLSSEEMAHAHDMGNYFRVSPDVRDLNYNIYIDKGNKKNKKNKNSLNFNSSNTQQLDSKELLNLLCKLEYVQDVLKNPTQTEGF